MTDTQKAPRPSGGKPSDGGDSVKKIVDKELESLLKTNKSTLTLAEITALRNKFKGDPDTVDAITEGYADQMEKIRKAAKKFAKHIAKKIDNKRYPYHKILHDAIKIKEKEGWSEPFFREFQRLFEIYLTGNTPVTYRPTRTIVGKALGHMPAEIDDAPRLNLTNEKEWQVVNKFLETYESTKPLWGQIQFMAMTYRSCAPEAIRGEFKSGTHNALASVHPILAAFFLPKINYMEEIFLYANLGYIVKCLKDGSPIKTRPNVELLNNISTDPMDIVCSVNSPMSDLFARYKMQIKVWESVLRLRAGQYYHEKAGDFLSTVDNCRLSAYDMPDLLYVQDIGSAVRRMFSAMSVRPTTVLTLPMNNNINFGPMPFGDIMAVPKVRKIPVVTCRLPAKQFAGDRDFHLEDSLQQAQWFLEDGQNLVYKAKTVARSDSILVFYVNRLNSIDHLVSSTNLMRLPMTLGGIEGINDTPIKFEYTSIINQEEFRLTSVLASEKLDLSDGGSLVTGSIALVIKHAEDGGSDDTYLRYDPVAPHFEARRADGSYGRSDPITVIPQYPAYGMPNAPESFHEIASKRGVIFVYNKVIN